MALAIATCPCGFTPPAGVSPTSADYHRQHRDRHLATYPNVDTRTIDALDDLIAMAERHELVEASGPVRHRVFTKALDIACPLHKVEPGELCNGSRSNLVCQIRRDEAARLTREANARRPESHGEAS